MIFKILFSFIILSNEKYVSINFDDGFYSVYKNSYPILKRYNFKFTLGLIVDYLKHKKIKNENDYRYLTIPEIKEMLENLDIEIASHSLTHPNLTKLKEEEIEKEVKKSKELLENIFKKEVVTFIYPYGRYDKRVINSLIRNGYLQARGTEFGEANFLLNKWCLRIKEVRKDTKIEEVLEYIDNNQYIILLFHRIVKNPRYFTDYSIKDFETLIEKLKERNVRIVTLKEMYEIWWQDFFKKIYLKEKIFEKIYSPISLDILR
ncbi:MAG: polysaccharide deacetylase family protein [candidate division WOR-3 bacterium]|nr:polysaccharide deacetylase family protein [candidate division WOR-3 bacterium]MCX7836672.1 polysaccharide deacetylase family protein [candidate division WOR-3 bacterium]MDW8113687.1 polysaccharide deacetylase family protein [candidate division WOR-3 bacterium]